MKGHPGLEGRAASGHHGPDRLGTLRISIRKIDHVATIVLASPAGSPRHLNILVRVENPHSVGDVVVLAKAGEDHGLCRHIDTYGEGLRGEEDLHEAAGEQDLHALLQNRHETAVVKRDALLQKCADRVVLRNLFEFFAVLMQMEVENMANGGGIRRVDQSVFREIGVAFTVLPAEDEEEGGQERLFL